MNSWFAHGFSPNSPWDPGGEVVRAALQFLYTGSCELDVAVLGDVMVPRPGPGRQGLVVFHWLLFFGQLVQLGHGNFAKLWPREVCAW